VPRGLGARWEHVVILGRALFHTFLQFRRVGKQDYICRTYTKLEKRCKFGWIVLEYFIMFRLKAPHFAFLLLLLAAALVGVAHAQSDPFSVTNFENFEANFTEWSLTAPKYIPGQYQARIHLANGYVDLLASHILGLRHELTTFVTVDTQVQALLQQGPSSK